MAGIKKKRGRERKKDATTTILNCKENVNEKKKSEESFICNQKKGMHVIR